MRPRIVVIVAAIMAILGLSIIAPANSAFANGEVFPVMNTSESPPDGIYFRDSPQTANTRRIYALGVFAGDQVRVDCYAWGDVVGSYGNALWYHVANVTRPTASNGEPNVGYINTHYINDGMYANQAYPGVTQCGASPAPSQPTPTPGGSLYYSPYDGPNIIVHYGVLGKQTKWVYAPSSSTTTVDKSGWYTTYCDTSVGHPITAFDYASRKWYTNVGAWSLARNEPFALFIAHPEFRPYVHNVVLFDPGNKSDYYTGVCSGKWQQLSQSARDWLALDPSNRLTVLAGSLTADYGNPVNGRAHAGIQNRLFPAIRNQAYVNGRNLRQQVTVCNYDLMSHENVWMNFRGVLNSGPIVSSCPIAPDGTRANYLWRP